MLALKVQPGDVLVDEGRQAVSVAEMLMRPVFWPTSGQVGSIQAAREERRAASVSCLAHAADFFFKGVSSRVRTIFVVVVCSWLWSG